MPLSWSCTSETDLTSCNTSDSPVAIFTSWENNSAVSGLLCIMLAAPLTASRKTGFCLFEATICHRTEQRFRATAVSSPAEQACQQHIVMAAAAASSVHTPPLCRCHFTFLLITAMHIVLSQTLLVQMNFPSGTYKMKYDSNATNWAPSAINVLRPSSTTNDAATGQSPSHSIL